MNLTIAYLTCRMNPRFEWFFQSLERETGGDYIGIKVVVVDHHFGKPLRHPKCKLPENMVHTAPKPTVWNGPHRLTTQDYFAASNARNTAVCHADNGYIAFVDDLSVLLPGWLNAVREAMAGGYIVLGCYKKMNKLVVENGEVKSFEDFPPGVDTRMAIIGKPGQAVPCGGDRLFGCSFAAPVEALLQVNGSDEDCDAMGGEDYILGMMLEHHGWKLRYDMRMMTYESEEAHSEDPPFKRVYKALVPPQPQHKDSSHLMLYWVRDGGRKRAPNYFGPDGIRGLRQKILAGEPFPICQIPEHHWPDKQPLREM